MEYKPNRNPVVRNLDNGFTEIDGSVYSPQGTLLRRGTPEKLNLTLPDTDKMALGTFTDQGFIDRKPLETAVETPGTAAPEVEQSPQEQPTLNSNFDSMGFNDAFKTARGGGQSTFRWKGKEFTTELAPAQQSAVEPTVEPAVEPSLLDDESHTDKTGVGREEPARQPSAVEQGLTRLNDSIAVVEMMENSGALEGLSDEDATKSVAAALDAYQYFTNEGKKDEERMSAIQELINSGELAKGRMKSINTISASASSAGLLLEMRRRVKAGELNPLLEKSKITARFARQTPVGEMLPRNTFNQYQSLASNQDIPNIVENATRRGNPPLQAPRMTGSQVGDIVDFVPDYSWEIAELGRLERQEGVADMIRNRTKAQTARSTANIPSAGTTRRTWGTAARESTKEVTEQLARQTANRVAREAQNKILQKGRNVMLRKAGGPIGLMMLPMDIYDGYYIGKAFSELSTIEKANYEQKLENTRNELRSLDNDSLNELQSIYTEMLEEAENNTSNNRSRGMVSGMRSKEEVEIKKEIEAIKYYLDRIKEVR